MKFQIDQVVIYEGKEHKVWDYSSRFKEYVIRDSEYNSIVRGVKESELKEKE